MAHKTDFDVTVIGGGIVGLASAYKIAASHPDISVAVLEKDVSVGSEAGLLVDLKAAFYNSNLRMPIIGFAAGLGGRDITIKDVRRMAELADAARKGIDVEFEFLTLRKELL